jgi:hypothetical protein
MDIRAPISEENKCSGRGVQPLPWRRSPSRGNSNHGNQKDAYLTKEVASRSQKVTATRGCSGEGEISPRMSPPSLRHPTRHDKSRSAQIALQPTGAQKPKCATHTSRLRADRDQNSREFAQRKCRHIPAPSSAHSGGVRASNPAYNTPPPTGHRQSIQKFN